MNNKLMNRILNSKHVLIWGIVIFAITLYLVNYSPWSSTSLRQYNGGYGTFDMKSYDADIVYKVLDVMKPEGFKVYNLYFIGDFLFIIGMGILQIRISAFVFINFHKNILVKFGIWLAIAKGIFDTVENTMILVVLNSYPSQMPMIVDIAKTATFLKLKVIILWYIIISVGIMIRIITWLRKLYINKT